MSPEATTTVLGVRHHGPGSARALVAELTRLRPDIVLIEGPPEADHLIALAADPDLEPPVALLAHVPGEPSRAAFWPFAAFSPEWQAIRYAAAAGIPARFCDLPAAHSLAERAADRTPDTGPPAHDGPVPQGRPVPGDGPAEQARPVANGSPAEQDRPAASGSPPEQDRTVGSDGAVVQARPDGGDGLGPQGLLVAGEGPAGRDRPVAGDGAVVQARPGGGDGPGPQGRPVTGEGTAGQDRPIAGDGMVAQARPDGDDGPGSQGRPVMGEGTAGQGHPVAGGGPVGDDDPARDRRAAGDRLEAEEVPASHADPIGELARAAGYDDPERWWEDAVEHRGDAPFEVIAEAMEAAREGYTPRGREARREAYMRKTVRGALKEGYRRVAVVCGAWHVPALRAIGPAASDERLLKGLARVKVEMTWVPWTYGRLASWSGYGAGVTSPGWYDHLFAAPDRPIERWLAGAAAVLREEDLPVSSAHVIEAVRLAHSLAVVRGRPLAGLSEVTEAVRAVLCEGDELPVELIQRRMVVGERLGSVPDSTPMMPLQRDLRERRRRLKMPAEALERDLDLDLRKPLDLERSRLLHRLGLLGVAWGTPREARGKGTFRESWTLAWRPEFDIELIEASAYGTTVPAAATSRVRELVDLGSARTTRHAGPAPSAARPATLAELTGVAERCLLADLPEALPYVLSSISTRAALDSDVTHLMAALPALVRAQRYGDVRGTPAGGLSVIVDSLLSRICAGLPVAATGLDDDSARDLLGHVDAVHTAVGLLESGRDAWLAALRGVAERRDLHGLIGGRLARILLDAGAIPAEEAARRMSRSMSAGTPAVRAAAWVEGFLSGSGLLLVHDAALLGLIDTWLTGLGPEAFIDVLPLLRRTFGAFPAPERRAIGARVTSAESGRPSVPEPDAARAAPAVATVLTILGDTR
ncbi:DUF5682 family protein [Sphaerisporangium sp. TRM90804]|uniref:DUF5682 family protein n=1 Tax=Sphaerisporangium sp. TRM90804 TaxID=3031113 RepID=UPI002448537B|nr:DUF5682 family protein [Sphaerisporangium sp. TRM90804]MDH2424110.1 DUF5682 family protein [Sphaerisporangium sp. TRM90804]